MEPSDQRRLERFLDSDSGMSRQAWNNYVRLRAMGATHERAVSTMRRQIRYQPIHGNTWNAASRHWERYQSSLEERQRSGTLDDYHRQRRDERKAGAESAHPRRSRDEVYYTREGIADEFAPDRRFTVTYVDPDSDRTVTVNVNLIVPQGSSDAALRSYIAAVLTLEGGGETGSDNPIYQAIVNATIREQQS